MLDYSLQRESHGITKCQGRILGFGENVVLIITSRNRTVLSSLDPPRDHDWPQHNTLHASHSVPAPKQKFRNVTGRIASILNSSGLVNLIPRVILDALLIIVAAILGVLFLIGDPVFATTTTLYGNQDAYIQKIFKNTNHGDSNFLLLNKIGRHRTLVGFDLSEVTLDGLTKATLVLTIKGTGIFWPKSGGKVTAHPLRQLWTEGEGTGKQKLKNVFGALKVFKKTKKTKGRPEGGPGVTWNCATDKNINNLKKDCNKKERWRGGDFGPATAAGVLHRKGMTGEVAWDVTADVLAGAEFGWLIKKRHENRFGLVRYFSKEGAEKIGKPNVAPKLILEFDEGPSNTPPVANAGPDQTVKVTDTVTLDGSGSSDADGDPLTFSWEFLSLPAESTAQLSDPSAMSPTFIVDVPGTYVIQLVVNDGLIDSAPETVTITTENSAPTANAGPDQTVLVGETLTLDGSNSSDVDGDLLAFEWMFLSRPEGSTAMLSDTTVVRPTFEVDKPGAYEIQLIVDDGQLASEADTVQVVTTNSPPVAKAGEDQTVRVTETVKLDGSASTDVDGDPLTFSWSFASTPENSVAELSDPTSIMPTFEVDKAGQYDLELIVNDGTEDSEPDSVTINTENTPPVADAGLDQTVFVNQPVFLNGNGSHDVDEDPLTYLWSFVSVPDGSAATLDDPTSPTPSFTPDKKGMYVVQLIANDGTEDSEPDAVVIDTENSKPVADAGPDQQVVLGATVQLDGSGSSDADDDPLTYQWALTTVPQGSAATLSDPVAESPSFVADVAGMYIAQLIVNDGTMDSEPDTVKITTINTQPIADPGPDQQVEVEMTVFLNGNGSSDPENDDLAFQWVVTQRPIGSTAVLVGETTATPTFVADVVGMYVIQLVVNDGQLDSEPKEVRVEAVLPIPIASVVTVKLEGVSPSTIVGTFKLTLSFDETKVANPNIATLIGGIPTAQVSGNLITLNVVSGEGVTIPATGEALTVSFDIVGDPPAANNYSLNLINCIDENFDAVTGCTGSFDVENQ